ncbi:MAG TPA: T-complex 10 C-terminal domain-containing protein [Propionibacteriaceae bacterium]|nr:T-complex 10 C-terminal domain-containing protein [Propionibacteriaceae bacterium]
MTQTPRVVATPAPQAYADQVPGQPQAMPIVRPPTDQLPPQPPAVEVPPDAYQVTEDIVVSDNLIAVTRAGTVVDTKVDGTTISMADGTRVTVGKDGTVTLDPNFRNPGSVIDANTMHGPGTYISPDGTKVQILDGKVVITDPNGEKLTVYPNGSVKIDVPEPIDDIPDIPEPPVVDPGDKDDNGDKPGGGGGDQPGGGGGQPGGGGGQPGGGGGQPGGGGDKPGGGDDTKDPKDDTKDPKDDKKDPRDDKKDPRDDKKNPPATKDIKVTTGDLLKDAAYFSQQSGNASTLSSSYSDVAGLIKEYGLWFGAQGPYREACRKFSDLYKQGSKQMTEMSGALTKAAQAYKANEEKGEELAEGIF